ncbi:hypothetical protein J2Z26_004069 [Bacillus luteolus]|nr:hypothetical protein [Cytobacillus luteolus]
MHRGSNCFFDEGKEKVPTFKVLYLPVHKKLGYTVIYN